MDQQPLQERYQIRQTLGEGGYGEVFLAYDQQLKRLVAIKRLRSPYFSPQINARFQQEALIMAQIKHPHILAIYDVFESDGRLHLVMEYSETGSLKTFLDQNGRLTTAETVELGKSLASGLDAAHRQGIIHRDVKPGNVLLLPAGDGLLAKLADFGIAHSPNRGEELTQAGDLLGTPPYWAPEQTQGRAYAKSDVYALGALLYRLLSGRHYLDLSGDDGENKRRIGAEQPEALTAVNPAVPVWLNDVVMRCLSKDMGARPTAAELYNLLHSEGRATAHAAATPKIQTVAPTISPRNGVLIHVVTSLTVALIVTAVFVLSYLYRAETDPWQAERPPFAAEPVGLPATVSSQDGPVNLRAAPDLSSEAIAQLADGAAVFLQRQSEDGAWVYLVSEAGAGWMSSLYISGADLAELPLMEESVVTAATAITPSATAAAPPTATPPTAEPAPPPIVTVGGTAPAQGLRLRAGPGLDEPILALLPDGAELILRQVNGDGSWALVELPDSGEQGWAATAFLRDSDGRSLAP